MGADDVERQGEKLQLTRGSSIPAYFLISCWIYFSNVTILFNKWIIDTREFRYPVILTCWHLIFATIATQILARTTSLLDGRKKVKMTGRTYLRAIVPIGLLYSASLVCSNMVYMYLSVAFIQMLKAAAPVAVLLVAWTWGVEEPSLKRFINIIVIVFGVSLASIGEIDFSLLGFMFQVGGIVFEAMRLVMIQVLLSGDDQKMDPLVSLYYYAPVCAVMNVAIAFFSEVRQFDPADLQKVGYLLLILNAAVAFLLNVSSVFLIGKTSGLVMTLTGILKNILLVVVAVIIWHTPITALQAFGYTVALAGLLYYSLGWDQIVVVSTATALYLKGVWEQVTGTGSGEDATGRLPSAVRRAIFMGLTVVTVVFLVWEFLYAGDSDEQQVGAIQAPVR